MIEKKIRVAVSGAAGRMGREVLRMVLQERDFELAGAVDPKASDVDVGDLLQTGKTGLRVFSSLTGCLADTPDTGVVVDFTTPEAGYRNIITCLEKGIRCVAGTTGMSEDQLNAIREMSNLTGTGCIVAPNFSIGALLMLRFAAEAGRYFPDVEIIELHHEQKVDYPSGTAIRAAGIIAGQREQSGYRREQGDENDYTRGTISRQGIRIHSVRLPGLVAHHEIIFGSLGQTLVIRHDSISRESFMPGIALAIRKVMYLEGMMYGLERLLHNSEEQPWTGEACFR